MLPNLDAFTRIASYAPEVDIVGSMYFRHEAPHEALVYMEQPGRVYGAITPQTVKAWIDEPAIYPCDAVGFGLTSISRRVLEAWDKNVPMFGTDDTYGSHDLWFCHYAQEQGFGIAVDSGIVCDHLTQHIPIGLKDNQALADTIDYSNTIDFRKLTPEPVSVA